MGNKFKCKPRTFKVIDSSYLPGYKTDTPTGAKEYSSYRITVDQTLDDVDRNDAMAIGANIYERWFMSTGIKRWLFGLLVKRYS